MKRIIIFLIMAIFSATSINVFGCTCDLPVKNIKLKKQVKKALKQSKAVFSGKVTEIDNNPSKLFVKVKLKIEKTWKNINSQEVIVITGRGSGDCGYPFQMSESYLVYAYGSD